jgi:hypothetical protein
MSGEKPIGDVVGSKSQRQLWNRAADGRRVRRQLLLLADAAERVAVATVRSCYQAVLKHFLIEGVGMLCAASGIFGCSRPQADLPGGLRDWRN